MKRSMIIGLAGLGLAILAWSATDASAAEAAYPDANLFGYMQYTGRFGSAMPPQYGFDRVRLGVDGNINARIGYRVMLELLDLNKPANPNTTDERQGLLDAILTYSFMPALKLSVGQFKTPFSMDYNTPASKLDVVGFGMSSNVSLNRSTGVMLSGRDVADTGIGYDIGAFNAVTRADGTSYTAGTSVHDYAYIGRVMYDGFGKALHLEGGGAHVPVTGGPLYLALYSAVRLRYRPLEFKAEWLQGRQGARTTTMLYGQILGTLTPKLELVGKWERTRYGNAATHLTADNWIFGLNAAFYPEKPQRVRLQINYVIASKDARSLGTLVGFEKGYKDDQLVVMLQAGF